MRGSSGWMGVDRERQRITWPLTRWWGGVASGGTLPCARCHLLHLLSYRHKPTLVCMACPCGHIVRGPPVPGWCNGAGTGTSHKRCLCLGQGKAFGVAFCQAFKHALGIGPMRARPYGW
jgi:hypothetical protein